ncbi:MAG: transposase [Armatimonadetes bacterium]|nr:transposase [Armatimonadota bacterium]MBI2972650.1 transposase [Armatimonadota bacterium]
MSRPPRPAFPGATYHITARGNNGERIFGDDADRYAYLVQLAKALRTMDVRLFAYALMSNHVHLALQTTQPNVSAMVRWLHTRHARQFNRRHGRINHLFGERFHSKVITDDLYLLEVTLYLHLNPVEAGLVAHPADYPWTSYRSYVTPGPSFVDVRPVLEIFSQDLRRSRKAYARFIRDELTRLTVTARIVPASQN